MLKDSQAAIKALMCKNASLIAAIKNEVGSAFRVLLKWPVASCNASDISKLALTKSTKY